MSIDLFQIKLDLLVNLKEGSIPFLHSVFTSQYASVSFLKLPRGFCKACVGIFGLHLFLWVNVPSVLQLTSQI